MQNEETLIKLGFRKLASGEYFKRGRYQKFTARVVDYNGPTFVHLSLVSPEIDHRPKSDNYGKHYRSTIKDCCSDGSIERALLQYDLPEECISRNMCGIQVLTTDKKQLNKPPHM